MSENNRQVRIVASGFNPVLYELYVRNERIGTIHFGDEANVGDLSLMHLTLDPRFWQSHYYIEQVHVDDGSARVYIQLERRGT